MYTGRAKKSKPLGKIRYLWNCSQFFCQNYTAYRGGLGPCIVHISLQYLVVFKTQKLQLFELKLHFFKVNK